jgi:formamidopyrimidine-DNA glycosylase
MLIGEKMPELPEVESVRRTLEPKIILRPIIHAECAARKRLFNPSPGEVERGLVGRKIEKIERLGKLLVFRLSKGAALTVHLGMTGQLICCRQALTASHIHMILRLPDSWLFFRDPRRFGKISFYSQAADLAAAVRKIGPDALRISDRQLQEALGKRSAAIKSLLLNQHLLAGVGNIYADEGLHLARIHPLKPGKDLTPAEISVLNKALKKVMRSSLALGGSTIKNFTDAEGKPGTFQESHRVYQKAGQLCPECGASIVKLLVAGRSTHFCPNCQQAARPSRA